MVVVTRLRQKEPYGEQLDWSMLRGRETFSSGKAEENVTFLSYDCFNVESPVIRSQVKIWPQGYFRGSPYFETRSVWVLNPHEKFWCRCCVVFVSGMTNEWLCVRFRPFISVAVESVLLKWTSMFFELSLLYISYRPRTKRRLVVGSCVLFGRQEKGTGCSLIGIERFSCQGSIIYFALRGTFWTLGWNLSFVTLNFVLEHEDDFLVAPLVTFCGNVWRWKIYVAV